MPSVRLIKKRGFVLFRPEQECPGFLVLEKGTIRVSLTGESGREVVLYRVNPGEICLQTFTCLIENRRYSAEGVVESDIEAQLISTEEFRRLIAENSSFRDKVFAAVAHRFADYEQLVEEVALTSFDIRLARVLLRLRDSEGTIHATHDQLAAETASGRAFVSRRLAHFARKGFVEPTRGQIKILSEEGLRQLAAEVW